MKDRIVRGVLLAVLLVSASFFTFSVPQITAEGELVTVTATNHDQVTVVEYKNNEGNIFEISSIVLKVDDGGIFKSFKTEKGWIGKKTDSDTITFTSTTPIKPGQSVKFGVKIDKPNPVFSWKAFDNVGEEIGSGAKITTGTQGEIKGEPVTTPTGPGGITDSSTFKIIPDTPHVGSTLRIIGESFVPNQNLDFYINDLKIDSFVTNGDGKFILSTKIPENQLSERADFIIKDQSGNQKSVSLRIQGVSTRPTEGVIALTVNTDSVYHRGDDKTISGTAVPGSTLTITISDSSGQVLTTYTVKADGSGNYSTQHRVASDAPFGEYNLTITDGKDTVVHKYVIETTQKINLVALRERYEPGDTVTINGTVIANKEIELTIRNPVGTEILSQNLPIGANGTLTFNYHLEKSDREGTYVLFAAQGEESATVLFGVGQFPSQPLIATMDSLNYKTSDKPKINIIGTPSATINLLVIDPSDKQKFADSFSLGADGYHTYSFNLTGYTTGIYTAVVSRGNVHVENQFSVGLQTSTGKVTLRTLQETYHPGDPILLIGDSNPSVVVTVSLSDPNGTKIKTQELFTDKKGVFSSSIFRIPSNAQNGVWKIEVGSGINHASKDLIVRQSGEEGITINLDKSSYKRDDIIQIEGVGVLRGHTIIIKILKDQTEIQKLSIVSTGIGSYGTIWRVPMDMERGTYTIKVIDDVKVAEKTFTVE
ncbi:MAG TPA: hypothetical protein VLD38_06110 [Nitrosopumilaceae archaeon]|nr:hypothetical protein [Nitrosopumilaceae archaeon]